MAFTPTIAKRIDGMGAAALVCATVTGDGSETSITAASLGLTRVYFALGIPQGVTTNTRYLSTESGTSIAFDAAPDSSDVYSILAFGY